MGSPKDVEEPGTSTLVLVRDAEYQLHTSHSSIVFLQWGAAAASNRKRAGCFSVSLIPQSLDDESSTSSASVPLVITAPFTPRFRLNGGSLIPLLRVGSPLQFETEFVPPRDADDCDVGCSNFQDQIIIQTRLAKLTIRLCALREGTISATVDPSSFEPRVLPSVKAPSFKLFDQIERDAAAAPHFTASQTHRVSIGASFHPQKHSESLASIPSRQATPPQSWRSLSRPSSSSHRRTPSPRVLEPLAAASLAPTIVTAVVDNQTEAKEVILRLRARRSSLHSSTVKLTEKNELHQPTQPEIHLDAKAKAELDEFNTLVKVAKINVAGERSKAKEELDFYKSLLPGKLSPSMAGLSLPSATEETGGHVSSHAQKRIPKKPARLPALPQDDDVSPSSEMNHQRFEDRPLSTSTNQVSSPVRRSCSKSLRVKGGPEPTARRVSTPSSAKRVAASKTSAGVKSPPAASPKPPAIKTLAKASTKTKQPAEVVRASPVVVPDDDGLEDFDDADPEIDAAPTLPDDLNTKRCQREVEDDEDDPMLTMRVPLY
jgi:hypothetical protein